jgi:hypothetical protein
MQLEGSVAKLIEGRTPISFRTKHKITFALMRLVFVAVPLLAGLDKFVNFITDWEQYVSPALKPVIPMSSKNIMRCAGVAEIAVGMTTISNPRVGSIAFALMLGGIILNLLTMRKQLHIASLDFCLAGFALAFAALLRDSERL